MLSKINSTDYNTQWTTPTAYAPLVSPVFTGDPQAPTPTAGDNDTSIATTAFVGTAVSGSAVRYDAAQSLTSATPPSTAVSQREQARMNIYAAPMDVLAYSGMQINGSCDVSQELGSGGVNVTNTSKYPLDGWLLASTAATAALFGTQNASGLNGIPNRVVVTVPTAQATIAASEAIHLRNLIEGYRTTRLGWGTAAAQPITVCFWTSHHRTGTYSVFARNNAADRSYVTTYTQNVADTWEFKTVTIPGCTDGTWLATNGIGLNIGFTLACGSTLTTATPNTWLTTNALAATGQVNAVGATSDASRFTGLVVLPGIEAPSSTRSALILRPYDQELLTCQRYWQKSYNYAVAPGTAAGAASNGLVCTVAVSTAQLFGPVTFRPIMRATPTLTLYSFNGTAGKWTTTGNVDTAAVTATLIGEAGWGSMTSSGLTAGAGYYGHYTADARL